MFCSSSAHIIYQSSLILFLIQVPTFVGFLRDIESAVDVKEYCREYLGDNPATHHFAAQFLEKRRSFRPKAVAHKDDMCSPAPAITPNSQHNSDFQEVKVIPLIKFYIFFLFIYFLIRMYSTQKDLNGSKITL